MSIVNSQRGFTLLEIILAVALMVVLVGAVYMFYQQTLAMRDDVQQSGQTVFAQRRVLDLMADEISSSLTFPLFNMSFTGGEEQMSFMLATVPSNSVYQFVEEDKAGVAPAALQSLSAAPEPQHDVQLIGYRLNHTLDKEGVDHIGGIERTCQRTIAAETVEEGSNVEVVLLSEHIKFLYLQYWDGKQWVSTWSDKNLPAVVKIALGYQELPEGLTPDKYPYELAWRQVAVPTSGAWKQEAQMRGGSAGAPTDVFKGGDVFTGASAAGAITPRDVFTGGNTPPTNTPGTAGGPRYPPPTDSGNTTGGGQRGGGRRGGGGRGGGGSSGGGGTGGGGAVAPGSGDVPSDGSTNPPPGRRRNRRPVGPAPTPAPVDNSGADGGTP